MPAHDPAPRRVTVIRVPSAAALRRGDAVRHGAIALGLLMIFGGAFGLWKWHNLTSGRPQLPQDIETLWQAKREPAVEFVDRTGATVAVRGPRYGRAVSVTDLPKHVAQAFIAAEDKRFYEHDGADETAIARAVLSNAASGETVSGASTITQQLIKNLVLDSRQTMERKAQEISLARELEKRMSKDEILSLYLNRIYFGAGLYGIDAASRFYFGKSPEALELPEAALLAALPKAPSRLNLRDNLGGAKERQAYVLAQMREENFITREQEQAALAAEVRIVDPPVFDPQLGYALDLATEQLAQMLPQIPGDAVVTVTIDPALQKKVEERLSQRMAKEGPALKATQAAVMIMDRDGRVVVLVGGVDYEASPFNRVTQARRQPGSSFKPFVYALALEDGYSPYDVFVDRRISIGNWRPTNYNGDFLGPMTLSEALTRSTNTIAAELGQETNPERVAQLAKRFGVTTPLEAFPSLALGSQEMTLWELTRAYGVFQSGGLRADPFLIERITDSRGKVYYERSAQTRERLYPADHAADMNAMLTRVVNSRIGTGEKARIKDWTVAGKTGTSQDWRDAWFIGFTAAYVGGVWVGNDDDSPMNRVSGGGLPADLWSDFMEMAHAGRKPEPIFGAGAASLIDPAAEARITFYRGMAQAFAAAGSRRQTGEANEAASQLE